MDALNTKAGVVAVSALIAFSMFYYMRNKAQKAVGDFIEPALNGFWSLGMDSKVELTPFDIKRLQRDFFTDDWFMMNEPLLIYKKAYPLEISEILTSENQLKPQYRLSVGL